MQKKHLTLKGNPLSTEAITTSWLKGGYPEPLQHSATEPYALWMENYQQTYVYRDIAKLFPRLNKITYQRFLSMLSKLSSTIMNKAELARALEVSEPTIKEYLSTAEGTFLWRQLPSYERNVKKSVIKMPKGHLRDSGLTHYLLKISDLTALYGDPAIGHSFEGFVIEELIKGLQATTVTNWEIYYYRTRNGAEIDLIIAGPFGILPIEIKYGQKINFHQLKAIQNFIVERDLPFGIVINQAKNAEWLTPRLFQLPVTWI